MVYIGGAGRLSQRSRRGQEAHPEIQDESRSPFQRSGSGRETPPRGQGGVGMLSRRSVRPSLRSGRGWEVLQEVQEGSGGPCGGLGGVGRPSQRSGSGLEALLDVREGSGGPSRRSRRGREALS